MKNSIFETIKHNGVCVGFIRLSHDTLYINPECVPDSDLVIIEDNNGYRYKRDITLTYKAQELPGCSGYVFTKI